MSTVRHIVKEIQREIRDGDDLLPERAADLLTKLAALLGNINDEIRDADMAYATVLLEHLRGAEKANRAKIAAETTPAYQRKQEARHLKELAESLIGSLKYLLRAKESEMRLTR